MGLSDLLATSSHSPAPHEAPVGSGLTGLVRPVVATVIERPAARMNLPQAMRALERGEITRPADGELAGMITDAELPLSRPPPPRRSPVLDEIHTEAMANAEIVRRELAQTIAAKRRITIQAAEQWIKENENE